MNIQDAARYSGKSEKTLRRWIRDDVLPAVLIQGRYDIKMSDLDAVCTVLPTQDTMSDRIRELERRVSDVEATIAQMSNNTPTTRKQPQRLIPSQHEPSTSSTLPDGWISLFAFCEIHNIAETTARRYLNPERVKKGTWEHDHSLVKVAIDPAGQRHLWNIFSHKTRFKPCDRCPHDEPSMP